MYKPQGIPERKKTLMARIRAFVNRHRGSDWPYRRSRSVSRSGPVSSQLRAWQMKKMVRAACCCVAVALGGLGIGWLGYLFLLSSGSFRLTELTVSGNRLTSEQEILELVRQTKGKSLLNLDMERIKTRVEEHPWVEQVRVIRRWPSGVEIRIREQQALALVNMSPGGEARLCYVNRDGSLFAPPVSSMDLDYPVLTGDALAADFDGMRVREGTLAAMALEFLRLTAKGNQILPAQAVSEVHVSEDQGVIVYLVDHPFPIYMGSEKMRDRFSLLVRVLARLYRKDKVGEVAEIRMNYGENKILVANTGIRTET